jgi:hypothetical protein
MNDLGPFPASGEQSGLTPNLKTATAFLSAFRPGGPWVLTAIPAKGGPTETMTFSGDAARAVRWALDKLNKQEFNIYYSANPLRTETTKKAKKQDIAEAAFVWADLDPEDNETPEEAKGRYLKALDASALSPTFVIDSGNGIQALYRLSPPVPLPAVNTPGWEGVVARVEAVNQALVTRLGCHAETRNIDRILRLPGSINWPNAVKLRKGRTPCGSTVLKENDTSVTLDVIEVAEQLGPKPQAGPTPEPPGPEPPLGDNEAPIPGLERFFLKARINCLIRTATDPADRDRARGADPQQAHRSERTFAVILACVGAGMPDEKIAVPARQPLADKGPRPGPSQSKRIFRPTARPRQAEDRGPEAQGGRDGDKRERRRCCTGPEDE